MQKCNYVVLLKRLMFTFLFILFYRALFLVVNFNYFESISFLKIVLAFIYGIRFDIATTAIINLVFIILSTIPFRNYSYKFVLKIIFFVFNLVFLTALVVDLEFFSFLGKKMTFDIFEMSSDIKQQLPQIIKNYWYFTVLVFANAVVLWRFYPRVKKNLYSTQVSFFKSILSGIMILVICVICVRGGIQLRSLSPKNAFVFDEHELGNISLNATYTMIRSFGKKGINVEKYFENDTEAKKVIQLSRSFKSTYREVPSKENIIIIIVESLSQEYIDEGFAPFISTLSAKSLYFENAYANGRRSIEVLPSIMAGFPSVIGKPLYQSQYQTNKFYPLPETLKKSGYSTSFFHGGKRGTMDFDAYCLSIGFSEYYAKEDYSNQDHYDGFWGIYDNYYLNYFSQKLDSFKEPFFSTIFTLSSHQPYSLPKEFQGKFKKGSLDIHESIGYIDESLKNFFEVNKNKKWFDNTLFVITADHTQKLHSKTFNTELGRYRVPILFYHPSKDLSQIKKRVSVSHVDILPSVLDYVGVNQSKKLLYGSSVFSNSQGSVFNMIDGNYWLLKDYTLIRFDGSIAKQYKLSTQFEVLAEEEISKESIDEIKAYIQYSNNGLKSNQIYH